MAAVSLAVLLVGFLALVSPVAAQTESTEDAPTEDAPTGTGTGTGTETDPVDPARAETNLLLHAGEEVYSQICSSCHQPGGVGLPGQFPPLLDNPSVDEPGYVAEVIDNGLQGQITVLGETYDNVMPSFSTLSEDDVAAVVAYIQSGFAAPTGEDVAIGPSGPAAGTELPGLASFGAIVAYLLAVCLAGLVLAPRLIAVNDRLDTPWLDAGLKTATIVVAIVFTTVVLPDWVLQTGFVADLDRPFQDIIGLAIWGAGLLGCLWGLWYAHRESRI